MGKIAHYLRLFLHWFWCLPFIQPAPRPLHGLAEEQDALRVPLRVLEADGGLPVGVGTLEQQGAGLAVVQPAEEEGGELLVVQLHDVAFVVNLHPLAPPRAWVWARRRRAVA